MKYSHKQYLKTTVITLSLLLCLSFGISSQADAVPVKIIQEDGRFQLIRGGEPYEVRGAGLELADIGVLASHGGNSIRTWSTENPKITALEVLDNAAKHGVTVAMCIEIGRERLGFDYEDEEAVAAQLEFARDEVIKYKDHPALLAWIIGNEVNLSFKNPKVFDAINDISRMIHEVDPNHPTTTALAGFNRQLAELVETRASDLDFVSMQMYADVVNLPRYVRETGYKGPYAVTEWGSRGHWEVGKTSWGAP
ncbi:MAG: glycoside hydrolase family 2 TIM barrel-domain containing protein, partial [Lysobacterales bacterium]